MEGVTITLSVVFSRGNDRSTSVCKCSTLQVTERVPSSVNCTVVPVTRPVYAQQTAERALYASAPLPG
jgi:hypothetical protein